MDLPKRVLHAQLYYLEIHLRYSIQYICENVKSCFYAILHKPIVIHGHSVDITSMHS